MKEFTVANWADFEARLIDLQVKQDSDSQLLPGLLFRGQANANWRLDTTLERNNQNGIRFTDYYRTISTLRPEIETFTDNRWDSPDYPNILEDAGKYDFFHLNQELRTSIYGYMAHLRHHGFPSPLLDWTRSAYVAAYFAFAKATLVENVSIYILSQARATSGSSNEPQIITFGPRVRTHKRHFLQQCEYSLCATMASGDWRFSEHENAVTDRELTENYQFNSAIYKFNIPAQERIKVLRILDQYNLNAFSLFGSEESLMETLALRQFHLNHI